LSRLLGVLAFYALAQQGDFLDGLSVVLVNQDAQCWDVPDHQDAHRLLDYSQRPVVQLVFARSHLFRAGIGYASHHSHYCVAAEAYEVGKLASARVRFRFHCYLFVGPALFRFHCYLFVGPVMFRFHCYLFVGPALSLLRCCAAFRLVVLGPPQPGKYWPGVVRALCAARKFVPAPLV
jgi:hypothetical protein